MNGVFLCVLKALELILHKLLAPQVRAQALEPEPARHEGTERHAHELEPKFASWIRDLSHSFAPHGMANSIGCTQWCAFTPLQGAVKHNLTNSHRLQLPNLA